MPHPISKLPHLLLTLRRLAEFIHQMQHRIAWQGVVPFLSLALSAHLIHGAREILKNIKSLCLQRQLAFAERTGQRGVPYQITGVKRLLAVTTPAIFLQVGRERCPEARCKSCCHHTQNHRHSISRNCCGRWYHASIPPFHPG